jgi:hypothetical protein
MFKAVFIDIVEKPARLTPPRHGKICLNRRGDVGSWRAFFLILQTNPQKAYEFGKVLLLTSTYEDPPYYVLKSVIESYSYKLYLPAEVYELAAEAYQGEIDRYPETTDIPKDYHKMAEWYWRACNRSKAIEAEQKAIEALKGNEKFSQTDLAAFESRLLQYKKM